MLKWFQFCFNFAFNFNVRRYNVDPTDAAFAAFAAKYDSTASVGRCRLTVSNPKLKALLLSTLNTAK
jgi:hypothetical protein